MTGLLFQVTSLPPHQQLSVQVPPEGVALRGRIRVPGDKSISHRALMLGAIAKGETRIQGLLLGEDPRSTARCFQAMGVEISSLEDEWVTVRGVGLGNLQEPAEVLDAGNSGTTLRLMLGLLASHPDRFFAVTGDNSLRSRPMGRVIKPLTEMGATIWGRRDNSLAPLAIRGKALRPNHYHSPIASAQVKSCVLLAGLLTEGRTTVTEPSLSRDHSERMLQAFGANLTVDQPNRTVTVNGPATLNNSATVYTSVVVSDPTFRPRPPLLSGIRPNEVLRIETTSGPLVAYSKQTGGRNNPLLLIDIPIQVGKTASQIAGAISQAQTNASIPNTTSPAQVIVPAGSTPTPTTMTRAYVSVTIAIKQTAANGGEGVGIFGARLVPGP